MSLNFMKLTEAQAAEQAWHVLRCRNLMSRRAYMVEQGMRREELEQLWSKREDISFGMNDGFWIGRDSVYANYAAGYEDGCRADLTAMAAVSDVKNLPENLGAGKMEMHMIMSPLVEVAQDMQTAKGMFYSLGVQTRLRQDGSNRPAWHFERQAADYVLEDGQWKIWHLFIGTEIIMDFGEGYEPGAGVRPVPGHREPEADPRLEHVIYGEKLKPQYDLNAKMYDVMSGWCPYPPVPLPYPKFDETFTYGPEPIAESGLSLF